MKSSSSVSWRPNAEKLVWWWNGVVLTCVACSVTVDHFVMSARWSNARSKICGVGSVSFAPFTVTVIVELLSNLAWGWWSLNCGNWWWLVLDDWLRCRWWLIVGIWFHAWFLVNCWVSTSEAFNALTRNSNVFESSTNWMCASSILCCEVRTTFQSSYTCTQGISILTWWASSHNWFNHWCCWCCWCSTWDTKTIPNFLTCCAWLARSSCCSSKTSWAPTFVTFGDMTWWALTCSVRCSPLTETAHGCPFALAISTFGLSRWASSGWFCGSWCLCTGCWWLTYVSLCISYHAYSAFHISTFSSNCVSNFSFCFFTNFFNKFTFSTC